MLAHLQKGKVSSGSFTIARMRKHAMYCISEDSSLEAALRPILDASCTDHEVMAGIAARCYENAIDEVLNKVAF